MTSAVSGARVFWNATRVLVLAAAASQAASQASAADIVGLGAELPDVSFDVPRTLYCRDVTTDEFTAHRPNFRLIEAELPVSVVVFRGDPARVRDIVVEVDGEQAGLVVHEYAPDTRLESEFAAQIELKKTRESGKSIDATLGGGLPLPFSGGVANVTPSISAGASNREIATETQTRLAPKQAVVVSGTTNHRRAAFFKLRQSSQSTLEGEHTLRVTFVAPQDWAGGPIEVTGVARGLRKWLFVEQHTVWNTTAASVELKLASHVVAKPAVTEAAVARIEASNVEALEVEAEKADAASGPPADARSHTSDSGSATPELTQVSAPTVLLTKP